MALNVVLYQPEIPPNTGNILRTCAATNVKVHLIKPLGFSLDEKYIKRSSANYMEHAEYTLYENWDDFIGRNKGQFIFLTRYGKKPHSDHDYTNTDEDYYLIFGSESSGIPKEILSNHLDTCYRLPMNEHIRSLNLSNCVAILVYEALRQQDYPSLSLTEVQKGADFLEE
ncbi:tRNA (cytidine(34)-2'-O)-methyltransferase [Haloplasma contractile]|uniref:Putative tRNA (cytidine(34)-2'-O)-methyltransferase n=1 Tax=Haloplasma contractile SSD-17B TaxID=1033810 RepID=U2DXK2_9MOLU|nr:tRNA (cytidine(34)-2'-O)-methyltransferase [Haloplasma contractile]ERJ13002.1 Putative tRNA -methyltransferase protein [Haloplasma contractile SSD-17B]